MMTDAQIQQLIDQKIARAQKNALYDITNASYHTHNGIDSPLIEASGSGLSVTGRSETPTTQTIPINQASTPQLLDFSVNDFANGITWGSHKFTCITAGIYLVTCTVQYTAASMQDGAAYSAVIKKNSTVINQASVSAGSSGTSLFVSTSDLVKLAVGDTISYYCMTSSNSAMGISGASGAIALQ